MLRLDADKRITAEAALDHPYLETYADHEDEVCLDAVVYFTVCLETPSSLKLPSELSEIKKKFKQPIMDRAQNTVKEF